MKESLMLVAGGNMGEYKEFRKTSIEDFIVRYNGYVHEIELQQEAVKPLKK